MFGIVYNAICVTGWSVYAAYGDPTPITWVAVGFHAAALFYSALIEFGYRRSAW